MPADMLTPEQLTAILHAFGELAPCLWPIILLTLAIVFRSEIRDLIGRLRHGKVLGQEIELSERFTQVQASAVEVLAEVAASADIQTPRAQHQVAADGEQVGSSLLQTEREILSEAVSSPASAVLRANYEIDRRISELVRLVSGSKTPQLIGPTGATGLLDAADPDELTPHGQRFLTLMRQAMEKYAAIHEQLLAKASDPTGARIFLPDQFTLMETMDELLQFARLLGNAWRKQAASDT